jgi:hypothetical protein
MADFIHMDNIIQGAVLQITERRPLDEQEDALEALWDFLGDQRHKVLMAKLRVAEKNQPPRDESAPDESMSSEVLTDSSPAPGAPDGS